MGWGITNGATPEEKIKSEMADHLRGLNATGELSYEEYSRLFDLSMRLLDEMKALPAAPAKAGGLVEDERGTEVITCRDGDFPIGTKGTLGACRFIEGTSQRVYMVATEEDIEGLVSGKKVAWYFESGLRNLRRGE